MSDSSDPKVISDDSEESKTSGEAKLDKAAQDIAERQSGGKLTMQIKVSSPFTTYFNDEAFSISGENDTGVFDILPKHHNFISLLKPCTLVIRTTKGDEQKINIGGGLMHVKADKVAVFLDI